MRFVFIILAAAMALASCAPRNPGAAGRAYRAPAPQPVFERQIRNAVDAGDGDYQVRALREKMAANPDDLQVRLDLAKAYRQRGFPDVALEHYRLAAARFPDSPEVAVELAKSLRAAGQRAEAARSLDIFASQHPALPTPAPLSWLGILRDEMGQWTEGEKAHRSALALAPGSAYLANNLGYNLLKQNRKDEAAAQFRKALALDPASALARNNLALALAGRPAEAIEEWRRLYDPATAHNNLAAVLIEQGSYPEARRDVDTALGYNQTHPAALKNLKLLSDLEGKPATLRRRPAETRREKWLATLRGLFVGPLPPQESKPAGPAVSSNHGRSQ